MFQNVCVVKDLRMDILMVRQVAMLQKVIKRFNLLIRIIVLSSGEAVSEVLARMTMS